MAEVVGVAASVVTLAALFSSCIDCFSYFKTAQNCPIEAETLLVKLDCEKARLLVWGNTVGILQTDSRDRYSQLADLKQDDLIRRCIDQITSLLTDARNLQTEYGGRATNDQESQRYLAVLSVNSMNVFQSAKRTFFARAGSKHAAPSLLSRVKWAIRDAAKFRILLLNLKDFVDSLIQLVPVPPDTINSIVEEDIVSTVDISSLRLIANACDEDSYPQWSARATEVIRESEMGTVDRRNLTEMLRDIDAAEGAKKTSSRLENSPPVRFLFDSFSKTSVVLTDKCLNLGTSNSSDCDDSKIGTVVTANPDVQISFSSSSTATWNLGRRLLSDVTLSYEVTELLKQREAARLETMKLTSDMTTVEPICRVYVHCGACACAINTARVLVEGDGVPEHVDIAIRIDDRIPTSCRGSDSAIDVLTAIRDEIEQLEASIGPIRDRSLRAIDFPALEKRIHALEQEHYEQNEPENALQRILAEDYPDTRKTNLETAGIIFIAEADICNESLERHPFFSLPRKPRASELYAFKGSSTVLGWMWTRDFIGRFSKSKFGIEREKARYSASQGSVPQETSSSSLSESMTPPGKRPRLDSTAG